MRKTLLVARREYIETARTKMFWFSALVPIAILVGVIFFGAREARQAAPAAARRPAPHVWRDVAVLDLSGDLSPELDSVIERYNAAGPALRINVRHVQAPGESLDDLRTQLDGQVLQGRLYAYLVLPSDILAGESSAAIHMQDQPGGGLSGTLRGLVGDALTSVRLREHGLPPDVIARVRQGISLEQVTIASPAEEGAPSDRDAVTVGRTGAAFFCLFLMFFTIVSTSQALLTALIEERSSRVVEVLLSAVSPLQLMAGKILGLAAIGLTLAAVCTAAVLVAAASQGLLEGMSLSGLAYFLPYYLLGFLLIASLYAAVGAACNTLKEAQTMMLPVMLVFMLPMMAWVPIVRNPNSWPAVALSLFPPTAPMVMMLRLGSGSAVPAIQIAASLALLAASAPLVTLGAAKAFRTGILMYGKPPKLRELLRWMRQG